jgi:hypothetical protein
VNLLPSLHSAVSASLEHVEQVVCGRYNLCEKKCQHYLSHTLAASRVWRVKLGDGATYGTCTLLWCNCVLSAVAVNLMHDALCGCPHMAKPAVAEAINLLQLQATVSDI